MDNSEIIDLVVLTLVSVILFIVLMPHIIKFGSMLFKKTKFSEMGESSKIRLIKQLNDAVVELSKSKTGAIITVVNKQKVDQLRTDGVKINASISAALILSIFNKNSPLHDGAIVIENNQIVYAGTYYKITSKSVDNKYGARHRAAFGISEQTDSLTIVVSEENGGVSFAKDGALHRINMDDFQEKIISFLK